MKFFLFTFHILSFLAWIFLFFLSFGFLSESPNNLQFEAAIHFPFWSIQFFQFAEILLCSFGLITAGALCISSLSLLRLSMFFLIFYFADFYRWISGDILTKNIPKGADFEAALFGHCLSWSLIEASRHLVCALDVYGQCPLFVVHLRFSLFTILYPTALCSELCAFWLMQQKINPFVLSLSVQNKQIFSYRAFVKLLPFVYTPCSLYLGVNVIRQRTQKVKESKQKTE